MSLDTPLTSIQELIERTIFHSIRSQCIRKGFTPDLEEFDQTEQGYKDYRQAYKVINETKGYSIEVFNSGAPADRVSKQVPRIVMSTQGFLPGSVGGDDSLQYKRGVTGDYYSYISPPMTSDLYMNIHIVSNNIEQHRVLTSIMALAVPRRGYIPTYPDGEDNLFVKHLSYVPVRQYTSPGMMETIYRYVCPDITEVEDIIISENISPLKEVELDISGSKYDLPKPTYIMDNNNNPIIDEGGENYIVI